MRYRLKQDELTPDLIWIVKQMNGGVLPERIYGNSKGVIYEREHDHYVRIPAQDFVELQRIYIDLVGG